MTKSAILGANYLLLLFLNATYSVKKFYDFGDKKYPVDSCMLKYKNIYFSCDINCKPDMIACY